MLQDLAFREKQNDRIMINGNHISHQYVFPTRSPGETAKQFKARLSDFQKDLPRYSDFSERLALAMRALRLAREKADNAAHEIMRILRTAPAEKKAEYVRQGIGYAYKPINAPTGSTRRGHRTKPKRRGISFDQREANSIRSQARRYTRDHKNFDLLFDQQFGSFRQTFRRQLRDVEWYAAAEKSYAEQVKEFEKRSEPFDWRDATPVVVAAQLYHEQRKFAPALLYYRKAISAARRAAMDEDLRVFELYWLRVAVKHCEHASGLPVSLILGPGFRREVARKIPD